MSGPRDAETSEGQTISHQEAAVAAILLHAQALATVLLFPAILITVVWAATDGGERR